MNELTDQLKEIEQQYIKKGDRKAVEGVVTLDYGSGGKKTSDLISNMILPLLNCGSEHHSVLSSGTRSGSDSREGFMLDNSFSDPVKCSVTDRGTGAALCDGAVLDIPGYACISPDRTESEQADRKYSYDRVIDRCCGQMVFSTDSFVVSPYFFPGGDIGKLSVCGTVNDISMMGAKPAYLSLSFIIEEGLKLDELQRITASIGRTAAEAGVRIVTGDTKVIEKGSGDGIYINTSGIGFFENPASCCDQIENHQLCPENIRPGDSIIVSGNIGDHGTAVMLARNPELGIYGEGIRSDCAPLHEEALALSRTLGKDLRCMRDPTRGGLGTTLNEFIEDRNDIGIELDEKSIPVSPAVRTVCEMLGLDPLYCACEGRLIAVTAPERAEEAVKLLRRLPHGKNAAVIGRVTGGDPHSHAGTASHGHSSTASHGNCGRVVLRTPIGTGRIITKLTGSQLPRIC